MVTTLVVPRCTLPCASARWNQA